MLTVLLWTLVGIILLNPLAKKWFRWTIKAQQKGSWYFYPMAFVMIPLDVLFNWIWGTMLFDEFPREFLFSTRVKRHYRTCEFVDHWPIPKTDKQFEAVVWARWLNSIDPEHITPYKG